MLSFGRRKERKFQMPDVNPKQPETLQLAIAKAIQAKNLDWKMVIFCRDPKSRALGEVVRMPVREAVNIAEDLPDWIRANHGAGEFSVRLANSAGTEEAEYTYRVFGAAPYNTGLGHTNKDGGKTQKDSDMTSVLVQFVMKSLESRNGDPIKYMEAMAGMLDRFRPSSGDSDPLRDRILSTLMDNFFVQKQNLFADLRDAMEFARTMQPQIPPEDPTVALLSSLAPMLTALVTSKTGMPVQQVMPNIMQQIASIPDHELAAITESGDPGQIKSKIAQLMAGAGAIPQGVALPHPGASQPAQQAQQAQSPPQPAGPDPHHAVVDTMIEQFRKDIRSGVDPTVQANSLIAMISYNQGLEKPHRLFTGLVNAGPDEYEREFDRFCAAVPELAANSQASAALKMALTMMLVQRHGSEDEDEMEEDDSIDASGSTGLRGNGYGERASADGAGPEQQDQPDGIQAGGPRQSQAAT